jgi:hypothetical protein
MPAPKDPEKYKLWKEKISNSKMGQGKGIPLSEDHKKKISDKLSNVPKSDSHKENISKSMVGNIPWNVGVPHKDESKEKMRAKKIGIPLSEEHKKKIGESNKGKHENVVHTPEALEANRIAHLGKKASEETKEKMSIAHKGKVTWNKGIPTPIPIREKMSKNMKGIKRSEKFRKGMSGENNIRWNGGITPFLKTIRELPEMYEWRSKVMKRDDYKDRFTGECGNGDLEVHHIIPFSKLLKKYNIKTVEDALSCKELWDIENGVTMFKDTHMEHHKKYKNSILPKEYYSRKDI